MTIPGIIRDKLDKKLCLLCAGVTGKKGQTLVEYAILLVLIAVVIVIMLKGLGSTITNTYSKVNCSLPS